MRSFLKLLMFKILMLSMTTLAYAANPTVASLKGTYAFQLSGVTTQWGYYNGNIWHNLNGVPCPAKINCMNQAFAKSNTGHISFNGAGKATFLDITGINNGSGGPVKGSVWAYSVSGFNGAIGTATNGALMVLGTRNASGIVMTVLFRTSDSNPEYGTAVLQQ